MGSKALQVMPKVAQAGMASVLPGDSLPVRWWRQNKNTWGDNTHSYA